MAVVKGAGVLVLLAGVIVGGVIALDALGGVLPRFPLPFVQNYANNLGNGVAWVVAGGGFLGAAWLIGREVA